MNPQIWGSACKYSYKCCQPTKLGHGDEASDELSDGAVSVSGNRSWTLGGAGAGFFFLWLDDPPVELRLDSDDAEPNLSLLFVINDLRGNGRGSGVTLLHMHSTSNLSMI